MVQRTWKLITTTFRIWGEAKASRMSAAMTYYTMLSLAPLLTIAIAIAGYVYDTRLAKTEIIEQIRVATSDQIADTVAQLIENATQRQSGLWAGLIGLTVMLYGASGVFSQLYDTFNEIWHVPIEARKGIRFTIEKRMIGVSMVLVAGVLLIGTLALGSVIAYLDQWVGEGYPLVHTWLNLADRGLSFLLMPIIFSLIFWFFPNEKIKWQDVWPAGVLTAMLIAASRYLINLYLQVSTAREVYGAAGSLVVLLVWVYITGMVIFFGASFSHAWAITFGSRRNLGKELKPDGPKPASAGPDREAEGTDATSQNLGSASNGPDHATAQKSARSGPQVASEATDAASSGQSAPLPPLVLKRRSPSTPLTRGDSVKPTSSSDRGSTDR